MGTLEKVMIPVLMFTGEHDPVTPRWHAEIVMEYISDKALVTWKEIENAGHFSFISPFPATLKSPGFLPSTDPPGFDREAFHSHLPGDMLDFLEDKLRGK